jgi:hypothetical protein
MEFVALYDYSSDVDTDLALVAGEIIRVLQKDESGWWLGENSESEQGYFPSNFVKPKKPPLPARANIDRALPPKPTVKSAETFGAAKDCGDISAELNSDDDCEEIESRPARPMSMYGTPLENGHLDFQTSSSVGKEFSITSLDAFDELMNEGFCIEFITKSESARKLRRGSRVSVHCSASLWDGAATVIHQFSEGDMCFTVGCGQVSVAMDKALLLLEEGDSAMITSSPQLAYGVVGHPPYVPPNSHIVYAVHIKSVEDVDNGASLVAVGPKELVNVVYLARPKLEDGIASPKAEDGHSVVFVPASNDGLSDEMLAAAARGMGIGKDL